MCGTSCLDRGVQNACKRRLSAYILDRLQGPNCYVHVGLRVVNNVVRQVEVERDLLTEPLLGSNGSPQMDETTSIRVLA